ncbi:disA bacterial checkpoint controller nucleotide-binding domain-containing protein [Ditylenchus destructor]|nr:disA bacterial checkpoint controller nucleotide-binding domain-containing protein [Ditylenchus destructor]
MDFSAFLSDLKKVVDDLRSSRIEAFIEIRSTPHHVLSLPLKAHNQIKGRYSRELVRSLFKSSPYKNNMRTYLVIDLSHWTVTAYGAQINCHVEKVVAEVASAQGEDSSEVLLAISTLGKNNRDGETSAASGGKVIKKLQPSDFERILKRHIEWPESIEDNLTSRKITAQRPGKMKNDSRNKFVDIFSKAVYEMSRIKRGTLIILDQQEQSDSLNKIESESVILDADFNRDLLLSIFNTSSPLHDKAMIIRFYPQFDDIRIHSARGPLPKASEEEEVRAAFGDAKGTRHGAALGASQKIDSMVVVVSEETGMVSICQKGEAATNVQLPDFEKRLQEELKRG